MHSSRGVARRSSRYVTRCISQLPGNPSTKISITSILGIAFKSRSSISDILERRYNHEIYLTWHDYVVSDLILSLLSNNTKYVSLMQWYWENRQRNRVSPLGKIPEADLLLYVCMYVCMYVGGKAS